MLTVRDIMNPTVLDKESSLTLEDGILLRDINPEDLTGVFHSYVNIVNSEGKKIGAVKTERLKYLVEMQRQNLLESIFDSVDVGIVVIDSDSRIFFVNKAYASILKVNISKIIGRYLNIIEPEAALLEVLRTGDSRHINNQHIKSLDSYVNINAYPLVSGGKVVGAYSLFTDVTKVNELHKAYKHMSAVAEEYNQKITIQERLNSANIIGSSKSFTDCISKAEKVAGADTTVLLCGESGTGKEILAKFIKNCSSRSKMPFITVNCSALPESLIESELFGYEEGSFTGALRGGRMGKFQLADKGTIFLDEIGDMPFSMQAKLLRVLQEGEIEKLGRQKRIPVDVRIIAATNRNLEQMVKDGQFREDLYYRLNVVSIALPPLRARENDILLFADYFLEKYNGKYNRSVNISRDVYQCLLAYQWPGNVRELENTIESSVLLCDGRQITLDHLPENLQKSWVKNQIDFSVLGNDERVAFGTLKEEVAAFERALIKKVLAMNGNDKEKTMKALALSERSFYRKTARNGRE